MMASNSISCRLTFRVQKVFRGIDIESDIVLEYFWMTKIEVVDDDSLKTQLYLSIYMHYV